MILQVPSTPVKQTTPHISSSKCVSFYKTSSGRIARQLLKELRRRLRRYMRNNRWLMIKGMVIRWSMQRWYRCWSGKKRLKKGIKKRRGTTNK
jgi:hypothetical protein